MIKLQQKISRINKSSITRNEKYEVQKFTIH